ncbi:MAG TPA: 1,2-phenylacetyl-CoA epoxidase subunit PaaC [Pseudonocardiaceae bacterium]
MPENPADSTDEFDSSVEIETHWAFGDLVARVEAAAIDAPIPADVDPARLAEYCLMLGDDALIFSHRLQEWCGRAPQMEDEMALANFGLDLIGQARLLLARAGQADGTGRDEDELAFFRPEHEFRNVRLTELGGGHFGHLIARLLVFSTWRLALLNKLTTHADPVLAAVARKGVKEVAYHRDYAAAWTVRLGDGTELSHARMREGLDDVWPFVGELFRTHQSELIDPASVRAEFDDVIDQVLRAATLERPTAKELPGVSGKTGRDGVHTEQLGYVLAVLQSVARTHPGARW